VFCTIGAVFITTICSGDFFVWFFLDNVAKGLCRIMRQRTEFGHGEGCSGLSIHLCFIASAFTLQCSGPEYL
jgi:hypothetical protein